jgi:hypothetical protein
MYLVKMALEKLSTKKQFQLARLTGEVHKLFHCL